MVIVMAIAEPNEIRKGIPAKAEHVKWIEGLTNAFQCRVLLTPEEDGTYSAHALRLPGVASQGDTFEEALDNIYEAFQAAIQVYLEAGAGIPWADAEVDRAKDSDELWIVVNV